MHAMDLGSFDTNIMHGALLYNIHEQDRSGSEMLLIRVYVTVWFCFTSNVFHVHK